MIDRRSLLKCAGLAPLVLGASPSLAETSGPLSDEDEKADYTLRIATGLVELSPDHIISTTIYNGRFPGPLLRLKEGQRIVVDIHNDTDTPELLHWHGQMIPSDVDGASEEGTPFIPPHGMRRISFVPKPSGLRFYHTHIFAGANLNRGTYGGEAGVVYIEPIHNPGAYDREVFLVLKEFEPSFSRGGDIVMDMLEGAPIRELQEIGREADAEFKGPKGYEVGYDRFSVNGKMLNHGEPIRVKQGERVLFHVLNASAGEIRSLALPGHVFHIVALDGNSVPNPTDVPVIWLGTAERISALVEMDHPGIWIMGDLSDDDRRNGMGIVIEYAGASGTPQWVKPAPFRWDYTIFSSSMAAPSPAPDETIDITIVKQNGAMGGFNRWTLNGEAFSMQSLRPRFTLRAGRRYRLKFRNASDDIHPLHLHRHSFELTYVGGKSTKGIMKDVVMLGGFQDLAFDFVANNPGPTLFHCHQQLHMDFGFMALFDYA